MREPDRQPARLTQLISRTLYGIEDSAAPIRDAQGQALGVVLVFHDVTEQRHGPRDEFPGRRAHRGLVNRSEFETRLLRASTTASSATARTR